MNRRRPNVNDDHPHRSRRLRAAPLILLTLAAVGLSGCASNPIAPDPVIANEPLPDHDSIYLRTETRFPKAVFYKPRESAATAGDVNLAPLIVHQTSPDGDDLPHRFGRLTRANDRRAAPTIDPAAPLVHAWKTESVVDGRVYTELYYVWRYAPDLDRASTEAPALRGIRVLCGRDLRPIVWQVIDDRRKTIELYVATSLENDAAAEFGEPLEGRKHAIEKGLDEQPYVTVARVIPDGPVPMGPYVYLDHPDRTVTTLLCRCMASQVDEFLDTRYYELAPPDPPSRHRVSSPARNRAAAPDDTEDPYLSLASRWTPIPHLLRWPSQR